MINSFCFLLVTGVSLGQESVGKILITPKDRTIVQRCFLELNEQKSTFCVAVGDPGKIHYALDLSTGSLVKIWKGEFLDATTMWTDRGEEQLAEPLGNKILTLKNDLPFLYSDSRQQRSGELYRYRGYTLSSLGEPTFMYSVGSIEVSDHIWSEKENTQKLQRTIQAKNAVETTGSLQYILARGSTIEKIGKNTFSIDDRSYIIEIASKLSEDPIIRRVDNEMQLVFSFHSLKKDKTVLSYSIIW